MPSSCKPCPPAALLATALLIASLSAAAQAVAAQDVFEPRHMAKLRTVTDVVTSPDGERVAYTLSVPRIPFEEDDGPAWAELHVMDREGNSMPFVSGSVNVSRVSWSPDGKALLYLAKREDDDHRSLYRIPIDGGESRRILAAESNVSEYSLSADGERVAFLATEARGADEETLRKKGFDQEVYEEDEPFVRVYIASLDAAPDEEPRLLDLEGSASEVHWSPAAERLAVALAPTPLIDDEYMNRGLHLVDVDTGLVLQRLATPGKLGDAAWSPDGAYLAVLAGEDRNDPEAGRLWLFDAATGRSRDLVPDFEGHVAHFGWVSPRKLVYIGDVWSETMVGEASLGDDEGRPAERVGAGNAIYTDVSAGSGGRLALIASRWDHPAEVYLLDGDAAAPIRRTDHNPWLDDLRLAKQETIRLSARDGLELEGILVHPLERASEPAPMILYVHGGPESHERNGWLTSYSRPGQSAAARGFAVFYANYRGSTGRGVAFSKRGQGDQAGKEFDDLVDMVDALAERGLIDPDHVGITGGSYGGYASAWGATYYSERFAAAVMAVGISNDISKAGTSDIPEELFDVHQRRWPWDDWQLFLERSPIYYVEQARTPILIMHGKSDTRVHPSQSLELYRHLEVLGKTPVRLVLYPGEGHGNRRAASRLDYNLRLLRWMEHYLQGPGGEPPPKEVDYRSALGMEKEEQPEEGSGQTPVTAGS